MLTKNQFCLLIKAIQDHFKELSAFDDAFEQFIYGHVVCMIGTDLVDSLLSVLEEHFNDTKDQYISRWLFAKSDKKVWCKDGREINLTCLRSIV